MSADQLLLFEEISSLIKIGVDYLHIDVMDGVFVPNITIGSRLVQQIRKEFPNVVLDVHLMINDYNTFIPRFIDAGANYITVHVENCNNLYRTLQTIRNGGCKAGVAFNPATSIKNINYCEMIDLVLLMGVDPGFDGQVMAPWIPKKVNDFCKKYKSLWPDIELMVDGGVDDKNVSSVRYADAVVSGSYLLNSLDREDALSKLKIQCFNNVFS